MLRKESKIDIEAKKREAEAEQKRKERERKLKEISKNMSRKDKRETYRFLTKHGLTMDEAKEYTQLGTEFDTKHLSPKEKEMLDKNFAA